MSVNDDKRIQSINLIEVYAYGTNNDLVDKNEKIKCNNIMKKYNITIKYNNTIQNFHDIVKENIKNYNPNWQQIHIHPYTILIIRGSGSGKTDALLNLISQQPDIDKIYLRAEDPFEGKH